MHPSFPMWQPKFILTLPNVPWESVFYPVENHCPRAITKRHNKGYTGTQTHPQIVIAIQPIKEVKGNIKSKNDKGILKERWQRTQSKGVQ